MKIVLILFGMLTGNFSPNILFCKFPLMCLYEVSIINERFAKRKSYVIQPYLMVSYMRLYYMCRNVSNSSSFKNAWYLFMGDLFFAS